MPRRTMIVPIIRKQGMDVSTFRAYWRLVHGSVAARLPGLDFYEQLHLEAPARCFGEPDRVYGTESYDGLAVLGFATASRLDEYRAVGAIMPEDEANAFGFAARYDTSSEENGLASMTRCLARDVAARAGHLLFLQRREDVPVSVFISELTALTENLRQLGGGVWLDFLFPRETDMPAVGIVDRYTPMPRQFQAVVRLIGSGPDLLGLALARLASLSSLQGGRVSRIVRSHLFVIEGDMTLSALRGQEAADLIASLRASNQLDPFISRLFMPPDRRVDTSLA